MSNKVMPLIAVAALAFGFGPSAHATEFVQNGGFEILTDGTGQLTHNTIATDWTVADGGYTFAYSPGEADTGGSPGQYGNVPLWGPNNGSNNGLPATSPQGGNYVAEDGAFQVEPIQQTITGLTPGDQYNLNFWWAGAQQFAFSGPTTDQFVVSLGDQTQSTRVLSLPNHGFSGWKHQTFTYTATDPSEVLSFLAIGTPAGEPPFALLDGVSMTGRNGVPEPAQNVGLLIGGLFLFALIARRVRTLKKTAA